MEIWKEIEGYEGYYLISTFGRVKSQSRKIYNDGIKGKNKFYISKEKIINGRIDQNGYLRVALCKNNKQQDYSIHRLVATAFIENLENKPCINHKDGNKLNNSFDNMEWVTLKENIKHAWRTGLSSARKGTKSNFSKLTEDDIKNIFSLREQGLTQQAIADQVGCTRSNISYILNKKTWQV